MFEKRFFPQAHETAGAEYARTVNSFARDFIYNDIPAEIIEQRINDARQDPEIGRIEQERHELGSLLHLVRGIELHEQANLYHGGAWQAALIRQPAHPEREPKPSETLTREEVADEFAAFPFREQTVEAERKAIGHYETLLKLNADPRIELSRNISLQRADIEVLINDLRNRLAERILDEGERKEKLAELDRELKVIIDSLTEDDWGKRLELEEIYLLRRLIHTADTGHLASVNHGTPREDLRPDRGSIDIEVTAAGDRIGFQLKTLKRGVSKTTRERQESVLKKAEQNIQGLSTNLVVLEAESVDSAYNSAVRRSATASVKRNEAFETLQPLIESLEEANEGGANTSLTSERHRLLTLLGLTEEDLIAEQEAFRAKEAHARQLGAEHRTRERERARAAEKLETVKKAEEEAAKQERLAAIQKRIQEQEEAARIAFEELQATQKAVEENTASRRGRKAEDREALAAIVAERKATEEAERQKEEKRKTAKARKAEKEQGWPPPSLVSLVTRETLQRFEFLPKEWKSNPKELMEAKKQFIQLFVKPRGKKTPAETDKPSPFFAELFPTKASFETPTEEDLEHIRGYLEQSRAA